MKIESVKINNILSIENAEVTFEESGLVLVSGFNHDSQRANGAGKSAIFNAIAFALFDKLPRKITATEILRRGCRTGSVEVTLRIGEDQYSVRRSRPKGVVFTRNGAVEQITQEEWIHRLKLNYDQFLIAAYCSQGTSSRFLSLNDADKKSFILQLLNLDQFSACRQIAENKVKNLAEETKDILAKVAAIEAKVDAYSDSLVDENVVNADIAANNDKISLLMSKLTDAQLVVKPDLSKYQKLEDDIAAKKTEFTKHKARRELLHLSYNKLKVKVKPFDDATECELCGSAIDLSAAKAIHDEEQAKILEEMAFIKSQINQCDSSLANEVAVNDLLLKVKDKKHKESAEYDVAVATVSDVQGKLNMLRKDNKELTLKLQNNSELESKIKALLEVKSKLSSARLEKEHEIELYKTVSSMYSPTGAQAYILDSIVESFNERILEYVNLLWSNMSYELTSYKENVKGEISAKFSEKLIMDGKEISMGSLSGGEFRALSLCVDFALVDVMERQFGISVSPVVLDEPFDGLDSNGRELIIDLLGEISETRQVVVIDHTSEVKSMFSKVINVEKRNGVSTVSLEA